MVVIKSNKVKLCPSIIKSVLIILFLIYSLLNLDSLDGFQKHTQNTTPRDVRQLGLQFDILLRQFTRKYLDD